MKRTPSIKHYKAPPLPDDDAMPNDEELESAVLGALLLEPQTVADVRQVLTRDAFYKEENAAIYEIICRLDDKGETADLVSVSSQARSAGVSVAYLAQLTQAVGSGAQVVVHAHYLAALHQRRKMLMHAYELAARAQSDGDTDSLLDWAQRQLDAIGDNAVAADMRTIKDVVRDAVEELEQRQIAVQQGECVGITTGLAHLDRITGGWRGGQLAVLAGRPSMGKTALSLLFARAAAESGVPVCYFSLEMTDTMLAGRMLVGASNVDAGAFRQGTVTTDDWHSLETGADTLRNLPLTILDRPMITMPQIRVQARAMQRKGRCGMVIIDYLQLISTPSEDRRYGNREREVAEISRAAKLLAKELDIPVVLLAQLSRKVEERTDKTPLLSDLRESGAIEQDADMVIFIDRPAMYGIESFDGGRYGTIFSQGVGRLTIAKNREGTTGYIPFSHNESLTVISDYAVQTSNTEIG